MRKILYSFYFVSVFLSKAFAGQNEVYNAPVNSNLITPATAQINSDGVSAQSGFPEAPLQITGKANAPLQAIIQNQSNGTNASGNFVVSGDLSGNTSFYVNLGMNSSKYSQAAQFGAEPSSAGYLSTSDSDLFIEAGINGNANGGQYRSQNSPSIVFITSTPVSTNIMMVISTTAITIPSIATVTIQGNAFSVGGSTFQVTGGSVSVNGTLSTGQLFVGVSTSDAAGSWIDYSGTVVTTGCSTALTVNAYQYMRIGKTVFWTLDISCTSSATTWKISFPFNNYAAKNQYVATGFTEDNGAAVATAGAVALDNSGNTIDIYKDATGGGTAWTASGVKRIIANGVFQVQ